MFLLQNPPPTGPFGSSTGLVIMGAIMIVFWLFFIRPQSKKMKEQKLFVDDLKKGDKVVTTSGIYGTIYKLNEDGTILLEVNPGSSIKMDKSAVSMEMTAQMNKPIVATVDKK